MKKKNFFITNFYLGTLTRSLSYEKVFFDTFFGIVLVSGKSCEVMSPKKESKKRNKESKKENERKKSFTILGFILDAELLIK